MGPLTITSNQNLQIKQAVKLKERKHREESGLFLIEGYRELSRAIKGGVEITKLFICEEFFLGENESLLIQQVEKKGAELLFCKDSIFQKLSYRDRPDGLVGIGIQMHRSLETIRVKENSLFVIAESIEKPGNLGAILRSADGVGADGVLVCDRCTDIYNPNVVRASVGTLFTLPVVDTTGANAYKWLKRQKMQIVAATPSATKVFTDVSFIGPIAIVVGTEQLGLSEFWMRSADFQVAIPMNGVADSLNVATAATLLLYEVLRQRNHLLR